LKKIFRLIAALLLLLAAAPVMANTFWNWSYVALPGSSSAYGSGTFETAAGPGLILNITGTANGDNITGLSNWVGADNILHTTGAPMSWDGISFTTAGGAEWNLYDNTNISGGTLTAVQRDGFSSDIVMSVTAVPEPESYALMLVGLGMVCAIVRRRKAKQV